MTVFALEQVDAVPGAVAENTALVVDRSRAALAAGADVVVLPELVQSGYLTRRDLAEAHAERVDGPFVDSLSRVARDSGGGLIVAGMCERDGDAIYNSVVIVGAEGLVHTYRKTHLFDLEREVFAQGDDLPIIETTFGRIGICVCYDLRFVEVLRSLALRGADVVVAPAAWVGGFDAQIAAEGLTPHGQGVAVQANLNQVAVVAVSQVSSEARDGLRTLGGSVAVDAYGEIVSGPLSRSTAESGRAVIDIQAGREAQVRSPRIRPRQDRRTDLYSVCYREERL